MAISLDLNIIEQTHTHTHTQSHTHTHTNAHHLNSITQNYYSHLEDRKWQLNTAVSVQQNVQKRSVGDDLWVPQNKTRGFYK